MRNVRNLGLLLLTLLTTGCAMAPLSNHITARSTGKENSSLDLGTTIGNSRKPWLPTIKYTKGLGDNLDFGVQYEVVSIGLWSKYSFINRPERGFSFGALIGGGLSGTGYYGYLGPVVSYRFKRFEPYFISRFNHVRYEGTNVLASIGEISFANGSYRYFQNTLGTMFWIFDWAALSLETNHFSTVRSPYVLNDRARWIFSGSFVFRL